MGETPAILIPCAPASAGVEGSVFPAIQNLMIAARALGLGSTLTTVHRFYEQEVKELLGIPEEFTSFALIPIGYPLGKWGEAQRRPFEEVTYWNEWKTSPPSL
jgi:nitroreductase